MNNYQTEKELEKLSIKSWAEEDRPREKMMLKGRAALSNAELIAILLSSGNRDESAVELSKRILNGYGNNLDSLGKASLKDLMKFKGIGEAKAISIAAALELGRRRESSTPQINPTVTCSRDAYNALAPAILDLPHEEFWILLLNTANRIIKREQISSGGVAGTIADPRMIFKPALENLAATIILCHNHPSGSLKPSEADIELTKKLKAAGKHLDIIIADHLIIGARGYFSFADEGLM